MSDVRPYLYSLFWLNILDALFTHYHVVINGVTEVNPLIAKLMDIDPNGWFITKITWVAALCVVLNFAYSCVTDSGKETALFSMKFATYFYSGVTFYHLTLLLLGE